MSECGAPTHHIKTRFELALSNCEAIYLILKWKKFFPLSYLDNIIIAHKAFDFFHKISASCLKNSAYFPLNFRFYYVFSIQKLKSLAITTRLFQLTIFIFLMFYRYLFRFFCSHFLFLSLITINANIKLLIFWINLTILNLATL